MVIVSYAFSQVIEECIESPQELHATFARGRDSLESFRDKFLGSNRTSRGLRDMTQSFIDVASSEDVQQSVLALLPQLKRSLSALHNDPNTRAEFESFNLLLPPDAGTQEMEDWDSLEKAVTDARRTHNLEREVVPLEIFFKKAVKVGDYGAAILHHERLKAIAIALPNLRLSTVTFQNAEGLRNLRMWTMLLKIVRSKSSEDDYAHLLMAESHLQEAWRMLSNDIVSRMELHQTLVALAGCTMMLYDNRADALAYLLKAASLEYGPYPYSHSSTSNGRVIEKLCCEWLSAARSDNFLSQLADSLSKLEFSSSVMTPASQKTFLNQCVQILPRMPSSISTLMLEEAQFLFGRSTTFRGKLQFWSWDSSDDWQISVAAIPAFVEGNLLGEKHPKLVTQSGSHAKTSQTQGTLDEAALMEELEKNRMNWGETHPATIKSMVSLADKLHSQGKLSEATTMQMEVVAMRRRFLGAGHVETIAALNDLAVMTFDQGRLNEAADMLREVLGRKIDIFGNEHVTILSPTKSLVHALEAQGKLDEAAVVEEGLVEKRRKILGAEHPDTLTAMNNVALKLRTQGKLDQAVKMQEEALQVCRKALGEEDTLTITITSNLATTLYDQGKLKEAEKMEREVVRSQRRIHGPEHPLTIKATTSLAITLRSDGNLDEARRIQQEILEMCTKLHSRDHEDTVSALKALTVTLKSMNNHANTLRDEGKLGEAVPRKREIWAIQRELLGQDHPDTLTAMGNLAVILHQHGHLEESATIGREVIKRRRTVLGNEHPDTLDIMSSLAATLYNYGKLQEAATLEWEVLETKRRTLGRDHQEAITAVESIMTTLAAMSRLASENRKEGKLGEAILVRREILKMKRKVLGDEHSDTLHEVLCLATVLHDQDYFEETLSLETEVVEKRKRILGHEDPATIEATRNLVLTITPLRNLVIKHQNESNLDEAFRLQEKVLQTRRNISGEDDPDTVRALSGLSVTLYTQGKLEEAAVLERDVIERRKRIFGQDHLDNIEAMNSLLMTLKKLNKVEESILIQREVLDIKERVLGHENLETVFELAALAIMIYEQGEYEEAATLEEMVVDRRRRLLGEEHVETIKAVNNLMITVTTMHRLAIGLQDKGSFRRAAVVQKKVVETRRTMLGEDHADTIEAVNDLTVIMAAVNSATPVARPQGQLDKTQIEQTDTTTCNCDEKQVENVGVTSGIDHTNGVMDKR